MSENKHYSFRDGLPTGPDVELIRKAYPDLKVGDRITYAEITAATGIEYRTERWRSVTNAWRARERGLGRIIECEKSEAFFVATADQISAKTYDTLRHITRSAKKQRAALSTVESHDVDDATRVRCQHQGRLMWNMEKNASESRKNLLPDLSTANNMPRLTKHG